MVENEPVKERRWHFLTPTSYHLLSTGPVESTRRDYKGKAAAKARKKWLDRYNKARREARLHARAALEDLWFLAQTMDADWLVETVSAFQPMRRLAGAAGVAPAMFQRPPLEDFLEALVGKVAWERLPQAEPQPWPLPDPLPHGFVPKTGHPERGPKARGEFFIARLAEALQRGLEADPDVNAEIDVRVKADRGGLTVTPGGRVRARL